MQRPDQTATRGEIETRQQAESWDCHVHVFLAGAALAPDRAYSPATAGIEQLSDHLRTHGIDRAVLVQPSPYGFDNACVFEALERLGPRHRAVIAIDPHATKVADLVRLRERGVRGLRFNPLGQVTAASSEVRVALGDLDRLAGDAGMMLEVNLSPATLVALTDLLLAGQAPIMLAHFAGLLDAPAGPLREALARLFDSGRVWLKASALDRHVGGGHDAALAMAADFLRRHAPGRVVWGSDWPHTPFHNNRPIAADERVVPHRMVDIEAARRQIAAAFGPAMWRACTSDTPRDVYA